jgi:endonuclease-3 related protein
MGIYSRLFERYGDLRWWPAKTPYEVMIGAILTQNTAWGNVEKALANFPAEPEPEFIENIELDDLARIIKPAGYFNQKSVYLKALTAWYKNYDYSVEKVRAKPLGLLREELLSVKGVGRETADSLLLYAFGLPSFVIDAYTIRLITRLDGLAEPPGYDSTQRLFAAGLDASLYNNAHAMIVINAKEHCAAKPKCPGCPLADIGSEKSSHCHL